VVPAVADDDKCASSKLPEDLDSICHCSAKELVESLELSRVVVDKKLRTTTTVAQSRVF